MKLITAIIITIIGIFGPIFVYQQKQVAKPADLKSNQRQGILNLAPKSKPLSVAGWYPHWDKERASSAFKKNIKSFDEVSPYWYSLNANGTISRLDYDGEVKALAKKNGVKVIPMISNSFDGQKVSKVINNPALRKKHIKNIVTIVNKGRYDGFEIDYEGLLPDDRRAFTVFIKELATELHKDDKILSVALMSKTSEPGTNSTSKAQDWKTIGRYADRLRIMAYDYHWKTSPAGPIAPYGWVKKIIKFGVTQVPSEKLVLGIGTYGYSWSGNQANAVDFQNISKKGFRRDKSSGELRSKDGSTWIQDSGSMKKKIGLAKKYNLHGVALWRIGGEDPGNWKVIREALAN